MLSKIFEQIHSGKLPTEGDYFEIPTSIFPADSAENTPPLPAIDFFKKIDGKMEYLRRASEPFSAVEISYQPAIWIKQKDFEQLRDYVNQLFLDPSCSPLPRENRLETLRGASIAVVERLFAEPSAENITSAAKTVGPFVYSIMKDPGAGLFLTGLSSHHPYTLQHSVGTAINCILLASRMGLTSEKDLNQAGIAGLLHDIGKVHTRTSILDKNGPLDEVEWVEMREHALAGYELLKDHPNPLISGRVRRAVLEHHEDNLGTGYPYGKKAKDLDILSRIVCISDIFNALTTKRSYSPARTPFEAFQLMREKLMHKIDDDLFKELVLIYGGQ